jgi:hypothetical protein
MGAQSGAVNAGALAAQAASLLTELNRDAFEPPPSPAAAEPSTPEPQAPTPGPSDFFAEVTPLVSRDQTDTAMLLRELSSLGLDDGQGGKPAPAPVSRPLPASTPDPKAKKRKGLFGRG